MTIKLTAAQTTALAESLGVDEAKLTAALAEIDAAPAESDETCDPVAEGKRMAKEQIGQRGDPDSLAWK